MASVMAPLTQRRHLTPLSPKNRKALQSLKDVINRQPLSNVNSSSKSNFTKPSSLNLVQPSKRSFTLHDSENTTNENGIAPPKRIKSASTPSCSDNVIFQKPAFVLVDKPPSATIATSEVHAKKRIQPLGGIGKVRSLGPPMRMAGQQTINKGVKRSHGRSEELKTRKPLTKDTFQPPARAVLQPVSRAKTESGSGAFSWGSGKFPKSWMFDIHEDTLEETLTNLVHHHTSVLDISDDEDTRKAKMTELERLGKENIPPTVDADVIAMPPPSSSRAAVAKKVDVVVKKTDEMDSERTRTPLGEVRVEDFHPKLEVKMKEKEKEREPSKLRQSIVMTDSPVKSVPSIVIEAAEEVVEVEAEAEVEAKDVPLPEEESVLEYLEHDFELDAQTRVMAEDELFA